MNESERPLSESHSVTQHHAGTPADALHTLLLFVIDNHVQFTEWLSLHSSKHVTEESVITALRGLDEVLHESIALARRPRVRMGTEEFEVITSAILAAVEQAEREGRIPDDPDANTGQYL